MKEGTSELVTLARGSPDFEPYLLGTFSQTQRALPLKTLNANSQSETVTFQVVPIQSIRRPSFWLFLALTFKVNNFLLVLFPLFLILVKNIADGTLLDPLAASISTCGVLFAFISLSLRNDYQDHMQGVDRVIVDRGSRSIQRGWTTALEVKRYSVLFLVLALLCALPVVIVSPEVLSILAVSCVAGFWAFQLGGDVSLFLLLGPLLTVGYQLSMGTAFDVESLAIGLLWGWLVLYLKHLRNISSIIESTQAKFKNTVNSLGFDRSRRLIAGWWILFVIFFGLYHLYYANFILGLYGVLILTLASFRFLLRLKKLSTPAGSEMKSLARAGRRLFQIALLFWTFENLWYLVPWKR